MEVPPPPHPANPLPPPTTTSSSSTTTSTTSTTKTSEISEASETAKTSSSSSFPLSTWNRTTALFSEMCCPTFHRSLLRSFAFPSDIPESFLPSRKEKIIAGVFCLSTAGVLGLAPFQSFRPPLHNTYSGNNSTINNHTNTTNNTPSIMQFVLTANVISWMCLQQTQSLIYIAHVAVNVYGVVAVVFGGPRLWASTVPIINAVVETARRTVDRCLGAPNVAVIATSAGAGALAAAGLMRRNALPEPPAKRNESTGIVAIRSGPRGDECMA